MLVQIPHRFFAAEAERLGIALPEPGRYGVGQIFFPQDAALRKEMEAVVEKGLADEGFTCLGWRDVAGRQFLPVARRPKIRSSEPFHRQVFIGLKDGAAIDDETFERRLYIARKVISGRVFQAYGGLNNDFYIVSMSCRTRGLQGHVPRLPARRLLPRPARPGVRVGAGARPPALLDQHLPVAGGSPIPTGWSPITARSTPSAATSTGWRRARRASPRRSSATTSRSSGRSRIEGQSDTACFDNALEFLIRGGYSLPHAAMMLIPEAWAGNPLMDEERRAFYEYHAALMEPWDGPAAMAFSDGRYIGATLDRNGLRPARYMVTVRRRGHHGLGGRRAAGRREPKIVKKWRLQPGKMLLIDLDAGRIIGDDEIKAELARQYPYKSWLARTQIVLEDLPRGARTARRRATVSLLDRQQAFGYTQEDLKLLMSPMATTGQEAVGSMGNDAPISALSDKSKLLYTYFKQNFAQVTNPPIDSIREELVMSLVSFIGPRPNLFDIEGQGRRKRLEVRQPILTNEDLEKIRAIGDMDDNPFQSKTLDITFRLRERRRRHGGGDGPALRRRRGGGPQRASTSSSCPTARSRPDRVPIPALLAIAGVHHHLIREGLRTSVGLVVETGDAREVHHFCALAGYGAEAINPYLAFETLLGDEGATSPRRSTTRRSSTATSRRSTRASSRSPPRWASRPTSPIAARRSSTRSA